MVYGCKDGAGGRGGGNTRVLAVRHSGTASAASAYGRGMQIETLHRAHCQGLSEIKMHWSISDPCETTN